MALNRLERQWEDISNLELKPYFLDLIKDRGISNDISSLYNVPHESPQILIIKEGVCVYHQSHNGISATAIEDYFKK